MAKGVKTGGRVKGVPNKDTTEIRQKFQLLIENNLLQLENDLKELKPNERINAILNLAKFVLPQFKTIELSSNQNDGFTPVQINFIKTKKNEN